MKLNDSIRWFAPFVLIAATLALVGAQAESGSANASVILPLTLTESATLEFGQLSASADAGTVVVDAAGERTQTGGVNLEGGVARPGSWSVAGEPSTAYTVTLPAADVTLAAGGDTLTVNDFTDSRNGASNTDGAGNDSFQVGATLVVGADQPAGTYSGSYAVTVAYQ